MTAGAVPLDVAPPVRRSPLVAWSVASGLVLGLVGAGLFASISPPVLAGAAVFFFLAVASDVHSHRVPNLVTLPSLFGALALSPWLGASGGLLEAAVGAGLGFALLVGPYAVGGVGAGDVKALMALGAWTGPAVALGAAAWALIAAGILGLALLGLRRELGDFARRWRRILVATLTLRRIAYQPPPRGSSAAGGVPFAAALAVGLAAQWAQGFPW